MLYEEELTGKIIAAAIEVHRALGPGLLESAYQVCLAHEFVLQQIAFAQEKPVPVEYKGVKSDCGYRLAFLVEKKVIVELKAIERILTIHEAQLLTYLKLNKDRRRNNFPILDEVSLRGVRDEAIPPRLLRKASQ